MFLAESLFQLDDLIRTFYGNPLTQVHGVLRDAIFPTFSCLYVFEHALIRPARRASSPSLHRGRLLRLTPPLPREALAGTAPKICGQTRPPPPLLFPDWEVERGVRSARRSPIAPRTSTSFTNTPRLKPSSPSTQPHSHLLARDAKPPLPTHAACQCPKKFFFFFVLPVTLEYPFLGRPHPQTVRAPPVIWCACSGCRLCRDVPIQGLTRLACLTPALLALPDLFPHAIRDPGHSRAAL